MGFVFGGAALTWLANPLLITSWIVVNRNRRLSFLTSTLAFVLSLSFLFFEEVISDEAGHYSKIISYESGYWLWLSSTVVMAMGNMLMTIIERKNR